MLLVAIGVTTAVVATHDHHNTSLTDASRVLQSVDVTMAPDGDLTAVKDTVVGTTSTHHNFTNKDTYSPAKSQDAIPVRITTAYRTSKSTGTDLSDLKGYTGPLQLQFTVQNLTVAARKVHYDVNGHGRSRSALVGVPMTVVAAATLDGVRPSAVRTKKADDFAATNGVLSQDDSGRSQVQWATILAPPQLAASTTFTLSLDATKFKVPDFDLSVQPGLVTDPSIGGLIDTAFNPATSGEMSLERRTVNLIGQVNTVLGRAGKTISKVRSQLNASSNELGTQTVADLKDSTQGVAASVKDLDSSITSLGGSLKSSLTGTRSQTLTELQGLVQSVDSMLGDTAAKPPTVKTSGSGCDVTVGKSKSADSIYGSLLQVVGQLDAYADATDACKTAISTSLSTTLRTATLTLQGADDAFSSIKSDLDSSADSVSSAITSSTGIDGAIQQADDLKTYVNGLLSDNHFVAALDDYVAAKKALGYVEDAVNGIHAQTLNAHDNLEKVNSDLADEICKLATAGTIDADTAKTLRSYTSSTLCDSTAVTAAPDHRRPLAVQIDGLNDLAARTDLKPADPSTGSALYKAINGVQSKLDELADDLPVLTVEGTTLSLDLRTKVKNLDDAVRAVRGSLRSTANDAKKALTDAGKTTETSGNKAVTDAVGSLGDQSSTSTAELNQMFALSQKGLTAAASQISTEGAHT
ncbi:MAG TPA: hypothetical protein VF426_04245, partial [Marmoricola sp.]